MYYNKRNFGFLPAIKKNLLFFKSKAAVVIPLNTPTEVQENVDGGESAVSWRGCFRARG